MKKLIILLMVLCSMSFTQTMGVYGTLTPSATDTWDIGSSTKLFRKGWLSEMQAILFAKNVITVHGGWDLIVKDAGTLQTGVGLSTTSIDFGTTMTTNDIVIMRNVGHVEYMQIISLVSGTTYVVTRNLDGSGANEWAKGTPWANLGYNGTGRIEIKAGSSAGDTRISLITQGTTYNAQTELIRFGDQNGFLGCTTTVYGIGIGDATDYLKYDPTNGLRLKGNFTMDEGSISWASVTKPTYDASEVGAMSTNPASPTVIGNNWIYSRYITSSQIVADSIKAGTFTGLTFRTAASGKRVVISSANNDLEFFEASGSIVKIGSNVTGSYSGVGVTGGIIFSENATNYMPAIYGSSSAGGSAIAGSFYATGTGQNVAIIAEAVNGSSNYCFAGIGDIFTNGDVGIASGKHYKINGTALTAGDVGAAATSGTYSGLNVGYATTAGSAGSASTAGYASTAGDANGLEGHAASYFLVANGATGSFVAASGQTVSVSNGKITAITP